jgi:hypothetical protein
MKADHAPRQPGKPASSNPVTTTSYTDEADRRLNWAEQVTNTNPARAQAEALIAIGRSLNAIAHELRRLRLTPPSGT